MVEVSLLMVVYYTPWHDVSTLGEKKMQEHKTAILGSLRVTPSLLSRLRAMSEKTGKSQANIVAGAVEKELRAWERKAK